jgi:hypothetical protein
MKKKLVIWVLVLGWLFLGGEMAPVASEEAQSEKVQKVWGTVTPPSGLATQYVDNVGGGMVEFVNNVLAFLTGLAAIWFLITIITSGIKIIQSAKSPEDFYTHMKKIMWAAVGMVLVALAYVITAWVLTRLFGDATYISDPVKQLGTPIPTSK